MPLIFSRILATSVLVVVALIANSDEVNTDVTSNAAGNTADKSEAVSALPKDVGVERAMMAGGEAVESELAGETELASEAALAGDAELSGDSANKDAAATDIAEQDEQDPRDKEEIWIEISDAISSLNKVVGDNMFLDLQRKDASNMEVRIDAGYWQRVRYQTRVDLKNDISNIWHLYVKQYHGGDYSSVRFVDDTTDKTIDIFTQAN